MAGSERPERLAVVLFNLGGPDDLPAVRPFLANLFSDPAILGLPALLRWPLAQLIASLRAPKARRLYERIGGRSPLVEATRAQAAALEEELKAPETPVRVFVAMRYWHPMSDETARQVKAFAPERIVLLPLYPQYSTTTTGSSLADWRRAARAAGLDVPTQAVCCYPTHPGLIAAHAARIDDLRRSHAGGERFRILFSAHGLPERVIEQGDPYQWQVEQMVDAIVERLDPTPEDWAICYQSRVGPMAWIGPSIADEVARAGADGQSLIVVPVAFVSEHSETLFELDILYRNMARSCGIPVFLRVPALGTEPAFIAALADLVKSADAMPGPGVKSAICPAGRCGCPLQGV